MIKAQGLFDQRNAIMTIRNASDRKGLRWERSGQALQKPRNENTRTVTNHCERDEKWQGEEESSHGLLQLKNENASYKRKSGSDLFKALLQTSVRLFIVRNVLE